MSDQPSKTTETIAAVTALVKEVPVYPDAIQPGAKELGKSLLTVAKLVNVVLAPVSGLVWSYDKIRDFVETRVAERLRNTPTENIKTPDPAVAGPALEALRYAGHKESLQDMYANLLANAIDERTAREAHPSFVDIIRNISPDEAKLLKFFSQHGSQPCAEIRLIFTTNGSFSVVYTHATTLGADAQCAFPDLVPSYIENLMRLKIINIPSMQHLIGDTTYNRIKETSESAHWLKGNYSGEARIEFVKQKIDVTPFGHQFMRACVNNKG
jgi:hypothetical protein